jgi:poly(A) polymerase/tRNA nucleotidyltransferase (CCA-adding enzyme)
MSKTDKFKIPKEVSHVTGELENAGFEAYIVGGCVRDLLIGKTPKDWDITTNAKPEEIEKLFDNTYYNNDYGTVGVVNEETDDETLKVVEVTPYRLESEYSDSRRPDSVEFSDSIEHDLKRRDFTINAIAYSESKGQVIDLHEGQKDIDSKTIRAIGDPDVRFSEDALRILRAIRISAELGFEIEEKTKKAIKKDAKMLEKIAKERIKDEFIRIIMSNRPMESLELAHEMGVLQFVVPELEEGIGANQNQAHSFTVWEHNLRSVKHSADKKYPFEIRLSALFHDIAKPATSRWSDEKKDWTFHGHDVVGGRMTKKILERLKFPKKQAEKIVKLVRWHLFFSDPEQITLSAVRRMVRNVGEENIWHLMDVRECDRIGMGRPKANPYRLRKYKSMVEEALRDPVSVAMLKIDGAKIMEVTHETPGPKIGFILHALLEEVLDDPKLNTSEYLEEMAKKLIKLSEIELKKLGEKGKVKKGEVEEKEIAGLRGKHWVK